jgi:hypothetical protein
MTTDDSRYLQRVLDTFIDVSIQRAGQTGGLSHEYRLSGEELRADTGRKRLHDSIINDVEEFFVNSNTSGEYDNKFGNFTISLDLGRCTLNRRQAESLSTAIAYYHEHNV